MTTLSLGERLILVGQLNILKAIAGKPAMRPEEIDRALTIVTEGHVNFYNEIFGEIQNERSGAVEEYVAQVLNMYRALDKAGIVVGDGAYATFQGFDGNMESEHHAAALFWVETMGRFSEQNPKFFNSHHPTLDAYGGMLATWDGMGKAYNLTREQALKIVAAGNFA